MRFLVGLAFGVLAAAQAWAVEVPAERGDLLVASGFLDEAPAPETCAGPVMVTRFSRAKEGGSFSGFRDAVAAHRAWVHGRGDTDVSFAVHRAAMRNGEAGFGSVITYPSGARFVEVTAGRENARDEAYLAFVEAYKANTDRYVTFTMCVEDVMAPEPSPLSDPVGE